MKVKRTYTLTMSEEQASLLVRALDLYSRIGIGQFEEVLEVYDHRMRRSLEVREEIRAALKSAKMAAGHPSNGSFGINNQEVADEFRAAYDLQQVVRHRLAYDRRPEGGIQVCFDEPRQLSEQPLATIVSTIVADGKGR